MTDYLDDKSRMALIAHRIKRAKETLAEVETHIREGFYNTSINRMYYACFYVLNALMLKNHINAQTHAGVKQMFGLYFVITGRIDASHNRFYNSLFDERLSSDYEEFVYFDKDTAEERYEQAKLFIDAIEKLIVEDQ